MRKSARLGLLALFMMGPAFGHAKLLVTVPAAGAELAMSPASMTLTFNEKVRLATLKLTVGGREIPLAVDREAAAATTVSVKLPVLSAGQYEVQWSALTPSDGHVVKGAYAFSVQ